jgi:hypothetical protein
MSLGYQYTFNVPPVAAFSAGTSVQWKQYYVITETFDPAQYGASPAYYLMAVLKGTGSNTAYARLYNVTDAVEIGQVSTTATSPTLVTSAALTMPATAKTLRVDFGGITLLGPHYIYAAKVRIDP